ncbi:MAG: YfhO family protein, partial [Anaerolineae bacterium]
LWQGLRGVGALALMALMGLPMAAGQLLPTLDLSGLSVRSGGLPYNEAASFSLKPGLVFKAFLPPLLWEPPFSEYVAYVGLIGLALAAIGAWAVLRRKRSGGALLILALIGVLLAFGAYNPVYWLLYKLVPGFNLFRAPARWLLLYTFGAAILAGIGLEMLPWPFRAPASEHPSRWAAVVRSAWKPALALLLVLELLVAGRQLAYSRPTAPAAFDSMRTAPSHLLADATYGSPGEPFRFLSMSDIGYDPGDLADLQSLYAGVLSDEAIYDLIVATKMKEVLAYNLPLRYRIFSVDGYDGGLLPTKAYVTLERLFLSEDEIWPDGRLRQQLRQVPEAPLLSLLNVKYVITDKTQDAWIDDVFYDLEHTVPLGELVLTDLPAFETTNLGVVSYLSGAANLPDGTPVAEITIRSADGTTVVRELRAGEHTADGLYDAATAAHSQALVGHRWRDNEMGSDYVAVLDLGGILVPQTIAIRALIPGEKVQLRGLSLIDEQTGTSRNLSIDPAYQLVHSGDVKIYQNLAVLPRAFIVHQARAVAGDEEALALMLDPAFDPAREVLLAQPEVAPLSPVSGESSASIVSYTPERVEIEASLKSPGYLVLTDAHYPGWTVEVDGVPVSIQRADLYFRAVRLEPGDHQVVFAYAPTSARVGLGISLAAWMVWGLACIVAVVMIGRKSASVV